MELVDNNDIELPMERMASTTGGGGIWGNWVSEDGVEDPNEHTFEHVSRDHLLGLRPHRLEACKIYTMATLKIRI